MLMKLARNNPSKLSKLFRHRSLSHIRLHFEGRKPRQKDAVLHLIGVDDSIHHSVND